MPVSVVESVLAMDIKSGSKYSLVVLVYFCVGSYSVHQIDLESSVEQRELFAAEFNIRRKTGS